MYHVWVVTGADERTGYWGILPDFVFEEYDEAHYYFVINCETEEREERQLSDMIPVIWAD
jgi:hypothetical protein